MKKLMLPIRIREVHVQAREGQVGSQLHSEVTSSGVSSILANSQLQARNGAVVMQCGEIQFRILNTESVNGEVVHNASSHKIQLLEWRPDVDFVEVEQLIHSTTDLTSFIKLVEKLHILCSIETIRVLKDAQSSRHHFRRFKECNEQFVTTMEHQGSNIVQDTQSLFEITSESRQILIPKLLEEALKTPGKDVAIAITRIYNNVEDIFQGKTDVLALLWADEVLVGTYNFCNMLDHSQFFQLLAHNSPGMRILEIGAGTGGFTSTVLPALKEGDVGSMCSLYHYTDISVGFFKFAKERFQEYSVVEYAKLDISQDPAAQGFQQQTYDLVIAANVRLTYVTSNSLGSALLTSTRFFTQR